MAITGRRAGLTQGHVDEAGGGNRGQLPAAPRREHYRRPVITTRVRRAFGAVAVGAAVLAGCSRAPVQVEGVKLEATTGPTPSAGPTTPAPLLPAAEGGLAVRLEPPTVRAVVGQPVTLTVRFVDAHGGLVGTVEDFGDGGLGGMKVSDCRDSEKNPSAGSKLMTHAFAAPGTYVVSVTVTTLSCVHGQEDVTATASVLVR